ncbi:hypothetical protein V6N13_033834 [Hibiscus sabdariffa]
MTLANCGEGFSGYTHEQHISVEQSVDKELGEQDNPGFEWKEDKQRGEAIVEDRLSSSEIEEKSLEAQRVFFPEVESNRQRRKRYGLLSSFQDKGCRDAIADCFGKFDGNRHDLGNKLKRLKGVIRKWKSDSSENFSVGIQELQKRANVLEEEGNGPTADLKKAKELKDCKIELWETQKLQEDLWRQKARKQFGVVMSRRPRA